MFAINPHLSNLNLPFEEPDSHQGEK